MTDIPSSSATSAPQADALEQAPPGPSAGAEPLGVQETAAEDATVEGLTAEEPTAEEPTAEEVAFAEAAAEALAVEADALALGFDSLWIDLEDQDAAQAFGRVRAAGDMFVLAARDLLLPDLAAHIADGASAEPHDAPEAPTEGDDLKRAARGLAAGLAGPASVALQTAFSAEVQRRAVAHAQAFRQAHREGLGELALAQRILELNALSQDPVRGYPDFGPTAPPSLSSGLGSDDTAEPPAIGWRTILAPIFAAPEAVASPRLQLDALLEIATPADHDAALCQEWRLSLAAGGAERRRAMGLLSLGAAFFSILLEAVAQGRLTGRGPLSDDVRSVLDALAVPSYALVLPVGGIPLQQMGAVGAALALGADAADALLAGSSARPDARLALARTITAVFARLLESRTMLVRLVTVVAALRGAPLLDPSDLWAGPSDGMPYEATLAVGRSVVDAALARTPGYGAAAPSPRTAWGAPIPPPHLARLAAPYLPSTEALEEALARYGVDPAPPSRFQRGVELTPIEFDRFLLLATEELKDPATGLSARGLAEALVANSSKTENSDGDAPNGAGAVFAAASNGPGGEKAAILRRLIQLFRTQAIQQLVENSPSLSARIARAGRFSMQMASNGEGRSQ